MDTTTTTLSVVPYHIHGTMWYHYGLEIAAMAIVIIACIIIGTAWATLRRENPNNRLGADQALALMSLAGGFLVSLAIICIMILITHLAGA